MRYTIGFVLFMVAACGGGSSSDGDAGSRGAECEQGGMASSNDYLPFEVGNIWRYQVTEVVGQPPETKRQELTEIKTPEGETEPVIVQITTKPNGTTESWFRRQGEVLIRIRQLDYDATGALERSTVYDPYKLRMDESAERTAEGAMWIETYTSIDYDPQGVETSRVEVMDQWTVTGVDVPCDTPWGQLSCLRLHEERLAGGIAVKDFYFARGYGKVREEGSQVEELIGCILE